MSSDVKTFKQAIRSFSHRLGLAAIDDWLSLLTSWGNDRAAIWIYKKFYEEKE
jgi:hypothetical protein